MNTNMVLKRGTPEWDVREFRRMAQGCKCISLGAIPRAEVTRVVTHVYNTRVMPTPERAAHLRKSLSERKINE